MIEIKPDTSCDVCQHPHRKHSAMIGCFADVTVEGDNWTEDRLCSCMIFVRDLVCTCGHLERLHSTEGCWMDSMSDGPCHCHAFTPADVEPEQPSGD